MIPADQLRKKWPNIKTKNKEILQKTQNKTI